jgi:hypothetical protein
MANSALSSTVVHGWRLPEGGDMEFVGKQIAGWSYQPAGGISDAKASHGQYACGFGPSSGACNNGIDRYQWYGKILVSGSYQYSRVHEKYGYREKSRSGSDSLFYSPRSTLDKSWGLYHFEATSNWSFANERNRVKCVIRVGY